MFYEAWMRNNKKEFGFWTANGSPDFAWMPPGLVPVARRGHPVPIRLQVGTKEWGAHHITLRHGSWLAQHGVSAAEMVYLKLSQPGGVYAAEEASKLKVNLRLSPTALLILRYFERPLPFLTVVTAYSKGSGKLDGNYLGVYPGLLRISKQRHVFAPPPEPRIDIVYRKRQSGR
jgi:hypothetical protein